METKYDKIIKVLRFNRRTVDLDKATFECYYRGRYSLLKTLLEFKKNNDVREDYEIPLDDFKEWLKTLGYERRY